MSSPTISIVVPSFNQGHYLEETLVSILNQEYPSLELFVMDGGSTDQSVEIIKKYESYITGWVSEKDQGQSDAINKGLKRAGGEILTWINSDDLLLPRSLHKVASYFSVSDEKTGVIHGGVMLFNEKKDLETRFNYLPPSRESYLAGMVFSQPGAFFRKKYLDRVGYLDTHLHYGMDHDLFLRLSLVCNFRPVPDVLAKYRLHEQSKSVAESSRFITDWKKNFVSLCRNLDWQPELDYLEKTGLYAGELDYHQPFTFQPDPENIASIHSQKTLCIHLGHVLKDLYWNERLVEARNLMLMIKKSFPRTWQKEDARLMPVMAKLKLPGLLLQLLKKVKRILK